jgi:hypothetical protein
VRGWGKRLTRRAARSEHPNGDAARAGYGWGEIFLSVHGMELPARPEYYRSGVACECELSGSALAAKLAVARPRTGRLVAPARLPAPQDSADEDSSATTSSAGSDTAISDGDSAEEGSSEACARWSSVRGGLLQSAPNY